MGARRSPDPRQAGVDGGDAWVAGGLQGLTVKLHPGDSPLGILVPWLPVPREVEHKACSSYL